MGVAGRPLRKSAAIVDASEQYPAAKGVDFPMPVLLPLLLTLNFIINFGIKITTPKGVVILMRSHDFRGSDQVGTTIKAKPPTLELGLCDHTELEYSLWVSG